MLNAEVLLTRAAAREGRLALPDGMSYRYLVLPQRSPLTISPRVLGKIKELAENGVIVVGARPSQAQGLTNYPQCDEEVKDLADALWGPGSALTGERKTGLGRVVWGRALDELVKADRLPPAIDFRRPSAPARLEWIHRRDDETEIYFVANLWPNRLIGDGMLPKEKRLTLTNVKTYETPLPPIARYQTYGCRVCDARRKSNKPPALLPSGLLGPVTLQAAK